MVKIPINTVEFKVAIGLIGYESKKEIARCLDPWVGHIDTMILGDGKFDYYDAPNDFSKDKWLDFAYERYKDKCEVEPYEYAGSQFNKRQEYMKIAKELDCDFLITVDTDEYLHPEYQDWDRFYKQLYQISDATGDRVFYQWIWIPDDQLWPKQGNKFPSNIWLKSAKIHKDPGTQRYCCNSHFAWCDENVTDEQIYDWQLKATKGISDPEELKRLINPFIFQTEYPIDGVRVTMDRLLRTKDQIAKGEDWAKRNWHAENAQQHYTYMKMMGIKPPFKDKEETERWASWEEFRNAPHTFDKETGNRKELIKPNVTHKTKR